MATVETGCRIHAGFQNLSLAHDRLYGGIGITLENPSTIITATPADRVTCEHDLAAEYADRSVELLSVPGAEVQVERALPRHIGLGSGTQLALGAYVAIARAHDRTPDVTGAAPALGRGGRSGIGVASFETGGLIVDGGHPTTRFTTDRPPDGEWAVPPVIATQDLPTDWRVVLVVPNVECGRHDDREEQSMASVIERADPTVANDVSATLTRQLLPAAATGDLPSFGAALSKIERLNGAWYADEQGGVFRPPIGTIVDQLSDSPAVFGSGQSSWGPAVYGLTDAEHASAAREAAQDALDETPVAGAVHVVRIRNGAAPVSTHKR